MSPHRLPPVTTSARLEHKCRINEFCDLSQANPGATFMKDVWAEEIRLLRAELKEGVPAWTDWLLESGG